MLDQISYHNSQPTHRLAIVIPAFNEEVTLQNTLKTVNTALGQVQEPVEVLIVNNSSTDRTKSIASDLGCNVLTEDRKGIAYARNKGLRYAFDNAISYILTTDGEARVPSNWIESHLNVLSGPQNIALTLGNAAYYHPQEESSLLQTQLNIYNLAKMMLREVRNLQGVFYPTSANMGVNVQTAIKAKGYPIPIKNGSDWLLMKSMQQQGGVVKPVNSLVLQSPRRIIAEGPINIGIRRLMSNLGLHLTSTNSVSAYADYR